MKRKAETGKTAEMDEAKDAVSVAEMASDVGTVTGKGTEASKDCVAPDTEAGAEEGDGVASTDAGGEREDGLTQERVAEMMAEAEQRGYLRGRNESIEELMRKPGMFERVADGRLAEADSEADVPEILSRRRVSIWDR